jgi:uncharacterized protein with WD repeat
LPVIKRYIYIPSAALKEIFSQIPAKISKKIVNISGLYMKPHKQGLMQDMSSKETQVGFMLNSSEKKIQGRYCKGTDHW